MHFKGRNNWLRNFSKYIYVYDFLRSKHEFSHVFKQTIFNFHTVYFKFVTNKKAKQKLCVINFKRASVELYPESSGPFDLPR